jgi:hypothetical protein
MAWVSLTKFQKKKPPAVTKILHWVQKHDCPSEKFSRIYFSQITSDVTYFTCFYWTVGLTCFPSKLRSQMQGNVLNDTGVPFS